jgi:hypothetical protein
MIQAFLRTFDLWKLKTLKDYLPRPSRLLDDILFDYKVLGGLLWTSLGPLLNWYWDRLLYGPVGLLDLGCMAPDGMKHKAYEGLVLG